MAGLETRIGNVVVSYMTLEHGILHVMVRNLDAEYRGKKTGEDRHYHQV